MKGNITAKVMSNGTGKGNSVTERWRRWEMLKWYAILWNGGRMYNFIRKWSEVLRHQMIWPGGIDKSCIGGVDSYGG